MASLSRTTARLIVALLVGALVSLHAPLLADALGFDVHPDRPTCLLYTIESVHEIPRIELKFISNLSTTATYDNAAQLLIQTLDPTRKEVHAEKLEAGNRNLAKWRVARVLHRSDNHELGWRGFSLAGDYSVCFSAIPKKGHGMPEHAYVSLLLGDPRSQRLLEKHIIATKGEGAAYKGSARVRHHHQGHHDEDLVTQDDAEEYMEWIDEIETHITDVHSNFNRLRERHRDFLVTSNTIFTRVWLLAALTVTAMGGTMAFMYKGVSRTLKEKKLV